MSLQTRYGFWREAFAVRGSIGPIVFAHVSIFGLVAALIWLASIWIEERFKVSIAMQTTPFELAGAALGVLLVIRTNAGYERWWEARKLWGGFVDRSRNFIVDAMAYGPADPAWRHSVAHWTASYPHVARHTLRGEKPGPEVVRLIGEPAAQELSNAQMMPMFVSVKLAELLRQARDSFGMDGFAFLQLDRERGLLIDNYGGCERILKTPLPRAYSLKIRHFIMLFLLTLPIALIARLDNDWLVPIYTMLVAYPLLALDQLGVELENPFSTDNLSHLPLDGIAATIEGNVIGMWKQKS